MLKNSKFLAIACALVLSGCGFGSTNKVTEADLQSMRQRFETAHLACCSKMPAKEKVELFCKAARMGQPEAQEYLGRIYGGEYQNPYQKYNRILLPTDYVMALMWYDLAVKNGHPDPLMLNDLRLNAMSHMTQKDMNMAIALQKNWKNIPCGVQKPYELINN